MNRSQRKNRIKMLLKARDEWYRRQANMKEKPIFVPEEYRGSNQKYMQFRDEVRAGKFGEKLKEEQLREDRFYTQIFQIEDNLLQLGHKLNNVFADQLQIAIKNAGD